MHDSYRQIEGKHTHITKKGGQHVAYEASLYTLALTVCRIHGSRNVVHDALSSLVTNAGRLFFHIQPLHFFAGWRLSLWCFPSIDTTEKINR